MALILMLGDHAARAERELVASGFEAVKESVRSRGGATGVEGELRVLMRVLRVAAIVLWRWRVCFSGRW